MGRRRHERLRAVGALAAAHPLASRSQFIAVWRPLASWVKEHEPDTLAYELSIADSDLCKVPESDVSLERETGRRRCYGAPPDETVAP